MNIEDKIEELLLYMACPTYGKPLYTRGSGKWNSVPLTYFDGAYPIFDEFIEHKGGDKECIFTDGSISDLNGPLNITILKKAAQGILGKNNYSDDELMLLRFTAKRPKDVRGKVINFRPIIVENGIGLYNTASTNYEGVRFLLGQHKDGMPFDEISYHSRPSTIDEIRQHTVNVHLAIGTQLYLRYEWRVSLAFDGCPGIMFSSDTVGIRELFRLRDLPPGKMRRSALRNWVKDHFRKKHDDPSATVFVRKHLRGATKFVWNDFRGTIYPPQYDLEKLSGAAS